MILVQTGGKLKLDFTSWNEKPLADFGCERVMIGWDRMRAGGALTFLLLCARAGAEPGGGEIGPQSTASIRISISVAARFSMSSGSTRAREQAGTFTANGLKLMPAGPGLRYDIVPVPADAGAAFRTPFPGRDALSAPAEAEVSPPLVLVVPD